MKKETIILVVMLIVAGIALFFSNKKDESKSPIGLILNF